MVKISVFTDSRGRQPFRRWYNRLDPAAANRVNHVLARIEAGSFSNVKGLGGGLLECRLHFGPGYRIYFGRDGDALIVLLAGGTKARQHLDIKNARDLWREYRRRKHEEA